MPGSFQYHKGKLIEVKVVLDDSNVSITNKVFICFCCVIHKDYRASE